MPYVVQALGQSPILNLIKISLNSHPLGGSPTAGGTYLVDASRPAQGTASFSIEIEFDFAFLEDELSAKALASF